MLTQLQHPIYGWQAGPQTPMLRLLLLLDGEATDMDEFELDLLGLSWAHVTIFLIGVDGELRSYNPLTTGRHADGSLQVALTTTATPTSFSASATLITTSRSSMHKAIHRSVS